MPNAYICGDCFVRVETVYRTHVAAAESAESPERKRQKTTEKIRRQRRPGCTKRTIAESIAHAVTNSRYRSAILQILATGRAAERAFNELVRRRVQKETTDFVRTSNPEYPLLNGLKSVESFSWSELVDHLSEKLPTLSAAVSGSMPIGRGIRDLGEAPYV